VLVAHLPPESATLRAIDPTRAEDASWSRTDQLLAAVFDRLGVVIWQLENQGRKSPTPRPRPLPRPGVTDGRTRYGTPRPLSEVRAILASSAPGAGEETSDGS
jgi:hypothetical protein